jgi:mannose-1-phosphate guanylyltransferase/mannose-6-phosphate isomerase
VILCVGSGTRLWPLSRSAFPKQFIVLFGKTTLFQQAVVRLQHLQFEKIMLNNIFLVTNEEHCFLVFDHFRNMKDVKVQ